MLDLLKQVAIGVSRTCSNTSEVCVKGLPQPTSVADGSIVQNILQVVIGIVAAICVLFVAIGGMRYILSQGDPQGVTKAKSTIMFALIGLAVTILAQGIVIVVAKALT
ncbi:MAG: hypothetical protein JWN82_375 [Candidatus Saccharibacteria bacterium]|nr:hypothetical protein [Candidatus Saccharibacteria bacterium]